MAISTTITALPSPPHRGVDSESVFVAKGEALFDALYASTVTEMNTAFGQINTTEANMIALEASAESFALTAIQAPGTSATSTTSMTIGGGAKSLTVEVDKLIVLGMTLKLASYASPTDWMIGDVTAYNPATGSLTVNVTGIQGSGTYDSWVCSLGANASSEYAATAGALATPRTINGVVFDGTANINIEGRMGTTIPSANTTIIGTAALGETIHISGTTTITSFGVSVTGTKRTLIFDSTPSIIHNATSLIIQGGANISAVAGLVIDLVCENGASGYWRVTNISHPSLSMAELGYLNGVTSNIQTQLNAKFDAPLSESTWTPTISGSGTNGSFTYTSQVGRYVAIGNMRMIFCHVAWSAATVGSGDVRISLPIAGDATTNFDCLGAVATSSLTFLDGFMTAKQIKGTSYANLVQSITGLGLSTVQHSALPTTSGSISFSMTYFT